MNTHKIRILLTALESGSLTRAGSILGYSQPGLTQMMKSLEEEVGFPLLIKTNRGVEPTEAAKELMPTMRQLINDEEKLSQEIAEIRGMYKGTIRIGSYTSTSIHWLPQVVEYFKDNFPEVELRVQECGQDDMVRDLKERKIDLALMSRPEKTAIEFIPLMEDPIVVVYSSAYDLSSYDCVPVEKLRDHMLLMTDETYDRDVRRVFEQAGFEPKVKYTFKDDFAVLSMVQRGVGIAILPRLIAESFPGSYEYRVIEPVTCRTLGIGINSIDELGPLPRFLIQYIKDNIPQKN